MQVWATLGQFRGASIGQLLALFFYCAMRIYDRNMLERCSLQHWKVNSFHFLAPQTAYFWLGLVKKWEKKEKALFYEKFRHCCHLWGMDAPLIIHSSKTRNGRNLWFVWLNFAKHLVHESFITFKSDHRYWRKIVLVIIAVVCVG